MICILNLPTVLRMCYYQLATHIKTYETFQKVLPWDYDAPVALIKINQRFSEYQNYLIGREYNPTLVKKQFEEVGRTTAFVVTFAMSFCVNRVVF